MHRGVPSMLKLLMLLGGRRLPRRRQYSTIDAAITFQPPFHVARSDLLFRRATPHPADSSEHAAVSTAAPITVGVSGDDRPILHLPLPADHSPSSSSGSATSIALTLYLDQTVNQLLAQIRAEWPALQDVAFYATNAAPSPGPTTTTIKTEREKWAGNALVLDMLRTIFTPQTTLYLHCDERRYRLRPPALAARLAPLHAEWAHVKRRFDTLRHIKDACDRKASRTARALGLGGLTLLCAQWSFMFRLTYFE